MSLANIAAAATEELVAKYLWRAVAALATVLLALIAFYHLTVAGILALEAHFGAIQARLMITATFAVLTFAGVGILWAMGRKAAKPARSAEPSARAMQIAMLVEAAMLGFEVSRKKRKAS